MRAKRSDLCLLANQPLMDRRVAALLAMTDLCRPSEKPPLCRHSGGFGHSNSQAGLKPAGNQKSLTKVIAIRLLSLVLVLTMAGTAATAATAVLVPTPDGTKPAATAATAGVVVVPVHEP